MENSFFLRLEEVCRQKQSLLCVGLDPRISIGRNENIISSIVGFNRRIIEQTDQYASCFKPNIAFYEAFGPKGLEALKETIALIPDGTPVIIDCKRNDIGQTAGAYAKAIFGYYGADCATINPYLGNESVLPFLEYLGKGLFALCRTSNPGSEAIQGLTVLKRGMNPLYIEIALEVSSWGKEIGLVVGATDIEALTRVRRELPEIWILAPGIGVQGGSLEMSVCAGIRSDKMGLLTVAARMISQDPHPGEMARTLRDRINLARLNHSRTGKVICPATELKKNNDPQKQHLLKEIVDNDCLKLGRFKLKSGKISPFYLDLRKIIANPSLLVKIADAYIKLAEILEFNRIAAIPVAAIPIATAISLKTGIPFIYPRIVPKDHGSGNRIEGSFKKGERVLLIDDLITTAKSKLEAIEILHEEGLIVSDLIVLIERDKRGREELAKQGIRVHSFALITELLAIAGAGPSTTLQAEPELLRKG